MVSSPEEPVIAVPGLVKTFGSFRALDGLDLTVAPARSTGSSAPTAPASRPRSAPSWACSAPTKAPHRVPSGSLVLDRLVPAALGQAPAVWLVTALAVAAYSIRSRWAVLGWAFLVLFLTVGQLGELLRLPRWVIEASPFVHVPRMPVEPFAAGPSVLLAAIASVLLAASWLRFRTRDIG